MRSPRMQSMGANTFQIYIDERSDQTTCGRVTGSGLDGPVKFSGISKLIVLLDGLLDQNDGIWSFGAKEAPGEPEYELEILFRQNYSWQGRLKLLKEGKEAPFRSVLELIFLLETV